MTFKVTEANSLLFNVKELPLFTLNKSVLTLATLIVIETFFGKSMHSCHGTE